MLEAVRRVPHARPARSRSVRNKIPMAELERDPEITPTSPAENPEGAAGAAREGPKEEPKKEEDPQTPKEEPKEDPTMEKNRTKKRKNAEGEQKNTTPSQSQRSSRGMGFIRRQP